MTNIYEVSIYSIVLIGMGSLDFSKKKLKILKTQQMFLENNLF